MVHFKRFILQAINSTHFIGFITSQGRYLSPRIILPTQALNSWQQRPIMVLSDCMGFARSVICCLGNCIWDTIRRLRYIQNKRSTARCYEICHRYNSHSDEGSQRLMTVWVLLEEFCGVMLIWTEMHVLFWNLYLRYHIMSLQIQNKDAMKYATGIISKVEKEDKIQKALWCKEKSLLAQLPNPTPPPLTHCIIVTCCILVTCYVACPET